MDYIYFIQQFRTPLLDRFFIFLNFFDRQEFLFILIPLVWLKWGWKMGLRLFYMLFLSLFFNQILKGLFMLPRPFHLDPRVALLCLKGWGLPSGAAQTSLLLSGILIYEWNNRWKWPIALIYTLLISFSRLYLGVHFLSDILTGWIIGALLVAVYIYLLPPLENLLKKWKPIQLFILSQLFPLLLLLLHYSFNTFFFSIVAMGMGIGLFIIYLCPLLQLPIKKSKYYNIRLIFIVLGIIAWCVGVTLLPLPQNLLHILPLFLLIGLWLGFASSLKNAKNAD